MERVGQCEIVKFNVPSVYRMGGLNDQVQNVSHQVRCCTWERKLAYMVL